MQPNDSVGNIVFNKRDSKDNLAISNSVPRSNSSDHNDIKANLNLSPEKLKLEAFKTHLKNYSEIRPLYVTYQSTHFFSGTDLIVRNFVGSNSLVENKQDIALPKLNVYDPNNLKTDFSSSKHARYFVLYFI